MAIKRKPHHNLAAVKAKFAQVETLEITRTAVEGARALGYSLKDIVEVVQALEPGDFIKSETAHSPPNSKVWRDTYNIPWDGADLAESDHAFQELRAEYAAHVRKVRKRLKLTQEEAGRLIGGGRRAFQKYENGLMPPSDAAVGLIEILHRHPEEIEFLKSIRSAA